MRDVDPFGYFVDHASAIAGQGGQTLSPDPRYCFHTNYCPVRPGPALYRLTLSGARATMGELTLRVHAYRPDGTSDVLLVAGTRLEIGPRGGEELIVEVRFRSVRDVQYACYGFFSEASDMLVRDLKVALVELEEQDEIRPFPQDIATSVLAERAMGASASQSSALVSGRPANLQLPVSQDCTQRQLRSREFLSEANRHLPIQEALQRWREIVCRQALLAYGAVGPGLRGILVGRSSPMLEAFCEDCHMTLNEAPWLHRDGPEALAAIGQVDFLVSLLDISQIGGPEHRYQALVETLSRLLIGGLGLISFTYMPDAAIPSSTTSLDTTGVTRNEIGQWLLRLIGAGYSAAPLCLAPLAELARDEAGRTAIVLVLRRL